MSTRTEAILDLDYVQTDKGLELFPRWSRVYHRIWRAVVGTIVLAAGAFFAMIGGQLGITFVPGLLIALLGAWFALARGRYYVGFMRGACPHCGRETLLPRALPGAMSFHDCPACRGRIGVGPSHFEAVSVQSPAPQRPD